MASPWTPEQDKANKRRLAALPSRRGSGGGTAPSPSPAPSGDEPEHEHNAEEEAAEHDAVHTKEDEVNALLDTALPNPNREYMFNALDDASSAEGFDEMSAREQAQAIIAAYAAEQAAKANRRGMR